MKKIAWLSIFVLNFYLFISYSVFLFYGCNRGCVLLPAVTRDIFGLGYEVSRMMLMLIPFSLVIVVPLLLLFYMSARKLQTLDLGVSRKIARIMFAILSIFPVFGIYQVIQRANQHPYYWDVIEKGKDQSYLSFISGDIVLYGFYYFLYICLVALLIHFVQKSFSIFPHYLSFKTSRRHSVSR